MQSGSVTFSSETDRIYTASNEVRVIDPVLQRVLVIDRLHSANAVVWNPWVDKAHRMSDFGDDEWPSMLCVEGGNTRAAAVHLEPGQQHRLTYGIRVKPLTPS